MPQSNKEENKVKFDYNDQFRERNYEDKMLWKTRPKNEIISMYTGGYSQTHECIPQVERNLYRCKQCQKTLKWVFFSTENVETNGRIIYNEFLEIESKLRETYELTVIDNFTGLKTFQNLRQFSYIIVQRPEGFGFQQIHKKTSFQIPFSLTSCKQMQIRAHKNNFYSDLQFYADYENSNLGKIIFIDTNYGNSQKIDYKQQQQVESDKVETVYLLLKSDTNTKGFTQWFNFGLKYNGKTMKTYKFVILNIRKKQQLYNKSLSVSVAKIDKGFYESVQKDGLEWNRACFDIQHYPNAHIRNIFIKTRDNNSLDLNLNNNLQFSENIDHKYLDFQKIQEKNGPSCLTHHSIEFSFTFKPNEQLGYLFAQTQPYTLTDLINFINQCEQFLKTDEDMEYDFDAKQRIVSIKAQEILYKKQIIGSTRLGFPLFKIQITASIKPEKLQTNFIPVNNRRNIVIIARQHPADAPSSQICEGIIKLLLDPTSPLAKILRQNFIFEIFPMANPDGVVVGNSRCNVSGLDMNKRWDIADPVQDHEVYQIKLCILKMKKIIFMCFDLQSTVQKTGCFLVGNEWANNFNSFNYIVERLLQRIMNVLCKQFFELQNCFFEKKEKGSIQNFSWKKLKVQHSFSLQASIQGYSKIMSSGQQEVLEFSSADYENIGENLMQSLIIFTYIKEKMRSEARYNSGELKFEAQQQQQPFSISEINKQQKELSDQHRLISIENEKLFCAWNVGTPPSQEFDIESYMNKNGNLEEGKNAEQGKKQKNINNDNKNNVKKFKIQSKSSKSFQINNQGINSEISNFNGNSVREISLQKENMLNQQKSTNFTSNSPNNKINLNYNNSSKSQSPTKQQISSQYPPIIPLKKHFKVIEDQATLIYNKQILEQVKYVRTVVQGDEYLDWKFYFNYIEIELTLRKLKNKIKINFNNGEQKENGQDSDDSADDLLENNRDLESYQIILNQLKDANKRKAKDYRSKTANTEVQRRKRLCSPKVQNQNQEKEEIEGDLKNNPTQTYTPQNQFYPDTFSDFQKLVILNQNVKNFERQHHFQKKNNLIYLSFAKPEIKKQQKLNFDELQSKLINNKVNSHSQEQIVVKIPKFAQEYISVKNPFVQPQTDIYQVISEKNEINIKTQPQPFFGLNQNNLNNINHLFNKIQESKFIKKLVPKQKEESSSNFYTEPSQQNLNRKNNNNSSQNQDLQNTNNHQNSQQQQNQQNEFQQKFVDQQLYSSLNLNSNSQTKVNNLIDDSHNYNENAENVINNFKSILLKNKHKSQPYFHNSENKIKEVSQKSLFQFYDPKNFYSISNFSFKNSQRQDGNDQTLNLNNNNFHKNSNNNNRQIQIQQHGPGLKKVIKSENKSQTPPQITSQQKQNQTIKLNLLDAVHVKQQYINSRKAESSKEKNDEIQKEKTNHDSSSPISPKKTGVYLQKFDKQIKQ